MDKVKERKVDPGWTRETCGLLRQWISHRNLLLVSREDLYIHCNHLKTSPSSSSSQSIFIFIMIPSQEEKIKKHKHFLHLQCRQNWKKGKPHTFIQSGMKDIMLGKWPRDSWMRVRSTSKTRKKLRRKKLPKIRWKETKSGSIKRHLILVFSFFMSSLFLHQQEKEKVMQQGFWVRRKKHISYFFS